MKYRIGIDCRLLGKKHAGIGRYVENLLYHLPDQKFTDEIEWVFFFYDQTQWKEFLTNSLEVTNSDKEFFQKAKVVFAPIRHYSIDEQIQMPGIFSEAGLDLLHIPHFNIPLSYPGRLVVTIHDLLWHQYQGTRVTTLPAWKYWFKHMAYRFIVSKAVKKAERIFVPAETVKQIVSEYFPRSTPKLIVTPEGVGTTFLKHATTHHHFSPELKALVYVGSLYPHKNIEIVLQALKRLPNYHLYLVGARNVFQDQVRNRVQELELEKQVIFQGYLSDEELIELLRLSFALVQPSLFEGFGLTGIEAMAVGIPVIASDIPIFKEVYKHKALLFDPQSVESFIEQVKKLEHVETYQKHTQFSHQVKEEYSWEHMTKQVVDTYHSLLNQ